MSRLDRPHTRSVQIGFLVLLALSSAQIGWWIVDQVAYTAAVRRLLHEAYQTNVDASRVLVQSGTPAAAVARLYPHLAIAPDSMSFQVAPDVLAKFDRQRYRRLNRYLWEGGFFLAVLLGAMSVVYRALHEQTQLHRRQEDFLAAFSHDLKSPLASLRLSAETLAMRDPPPQRRTELVGRLLDDLGRLDRMIGNILDASRLAKPSNASHPTTVDLGVEVAHAVDDIRHQATGLGVTITTDVATDSSLHADPEAVRTVIRNLLHNGVKAAGQGGHVTITGGRDAGQVRLTVADDGVGFPPLEATRLFEKFYRVEGDERELLTGSGLGLYLVKRGVELDGGTVEAASEGDNRGAIFTVRWPLRQEPA